MKIPLRFKYLILEEFDELTNSLTPSSETSLQKLKSKSSRF